MLQRILDSGVREEMPDYFQRRIRMNNAMGLVVGIAAGAGFGIHSLFYNPQLAWLPFLGFALNVPIFILNRLGVHKLAKFVGSTIPLMLIMGYVASLTGAKEAAPSGAMSLVMVFLILPALNCDPRERSFYILTTLNLIIFGGFEWYKGLISNAGVNREVFDVFPWSWLTMMLGAFLLIGSILLLVFTYRNVEKKAISAVEDAEAKTKESEQARVALEENLEELSSSRKKEQEQQWIAEGVNRINNILGDASKREKVYFFLNQYFVQYTQASQGLFLTIERSENEEDDAVTLVSQVGYTEEWRKFPRREILPGDGLLGQALMNKKHILLEQVPADYSKIKSVLGDARPKSVLIVPMIVNEQVEGMIELVSFSTFTHKEIEFLERAGEIIAAFIVVNEGAKRMQALLQMSEQQAMELREKEEEMMQNAEEMQATQEELKRTEKRFMARIEELEAELERLRDS